jgi:hypothetical protein
VNVKIPPLSWATLMFHSLTCPAAPVATWMYHVNASRLMIVCTPSENVKAVGVMVCNGLFGASGPANVNIPVTKSLVV